ncbi:MAG: S-layer family protein [Cyanobacteria bacterium J06641_5]
MALQGENASNGIGSNITSQVEPGANGVSGGIDLAVDSLSLMDGGFISATTLGNGSAGEIRIQALNAVTLQGESSAALPSSILNQVTPTADGDSGGINIEADSFTLSDGAFLSANTLGSGNAGLVQIFTRGPVTLQGEDSQGNPSTILSLVEVGANGDSGGIEIDASSFSLLDGAFLNASTSSAGNAGLVQIRADGAAVLQGTSNQGIPSTIFSAVQPGGEGNSAEIIIAAGSFSVLDGASLSANTFAAGDAGLIQIRTVGAVILQGENSSNGVGSNITSQVGLDAAGDSGGLDGIAIDIEAGSLSLADGSFISATTLGEGDAGDIVVLVANSLTVEGESSLGNASNILSQVETEATGDSGTVDITANHLALLDGGQLNSSTLGNGNAGDIAVEVVAGIALQGESPQGNRSGIFSTVAAGAGGDLEAASGSITLQADAIALQENTAIEVDSQGIAPGGEIEIAGGSLELSDNTSITATAASNEGGSVILGLQDDLFLRENSFISAEAGTVGGEGQGGTLDITARFVVAFPGNNDLNANAFNGPGGNIIIETEGLFGLELRDILNPREVPTNDITVSSSLEANSGTFELVSPEVDPSDNLAVLPATTLDVASLIDRRCALTANDAVGRFAVIGRGGLPPDPRSPVASSPLLPDFGTDEPQSVALPPLRPSRSPVPAPVTFVEARGWQSDASGQVLWLMGSAEPVVGQPAPSACQRPKTQ